MRRLLKLTCFSALAATIFLSDTIAQGDVVKNVSCPSEISVGSVQNLGDWKLPAARAKYSNVKLEVRSLAGRQYYSAVCFYSAYRGKVSIEKVMGSTSVLRNCRVFSQQGGTGGVRCS